MKKKTKIKLAYASEYNSERENQAILFNQVILGIDIAFIGSTHLLLKANLICLKKSSEITFTVTLH